MTTNKFSIYPGVSLYSEEQDKSESNVVSLPIQQTRVDQCMGTLMQKHNAKELATIYAVTIDKAGNVDIRWGDTGSNVKTYMLVAACLDMLRQNLIGLASNDVIGGGSAN